MNAAKHLCIFRIVKGLSAMQDWPILAFTAVLCLFGVVCAAWLSPHTQQRLASVNERDWLVDALVWIHRRLWGEPEKR